MGHREELLVSALPLTLRIEPGAVTGELRIVVEGFDPIDVRPAEKIVLRPDEHAVVIEREYWRAGL
jgi:hypothetical protein